MAGVDDAVVEKSMWSTFIVDAVRTAALIVMLALPRSVNTVLDVPDRSPDKLTVNTGSGLLEIPVQSTDALTLELAEVTALDDVTADDDITELADIVALVETVAELEIFALPDINALEDIVADAMLAG